MPQLSSEQANQLAGNFLAMAQAVGDYRYLNFAALTKMENQTLSSLHLSLLNYADQLYTLSATLVLDDVADSLAEINTVTAEIQATFKTLQKVQKAINVAGSVASLGAAIVSKNPKAIGASLSDLKAAWTA